MCTKLLSKNAAILSNTRVCYGGKESSRLLVVHAKFMVSCYSCFRWVIFSFLYKSTILEKSSLSAKPLCCCRDLNSQDLSSLRKLPLLRHDLLFYQNLFLRIRGKRAYKRKEGHRKGMALMPNRKNLITASTQYL